MHPLELNRLRRKGRKLMTLCSLWIAVTTRIISTKSSLMICALTTMKWIRRNFKLSQNSQK
jgi:hypothetical protein